MNAGEFSSDGCSVLLNRGSGLPVSIYDTQSLLEVTPSVTQGFVSASDPELEYFSPPPLKLKVPRLRGVHLKRMCISTSLNLQKCINLASGALQTESVLIGRLSSSVRIAAV